MGVYKNDSNEKSRYFFNSIDFYLAFVMIVASLVVIYKVTGGLYVNF